jgi:hypothetical protein
MNTTVEISDHPIYSQIKRKVLLQPLTIDYAGSVANWPFQVVHLNEAGEELLEVPRANGNFRLSNERMVNPDNGVRLPAGETEVPAASDGADPKAAVGEFTLLRGMLMQPDIDPLVLGKMRAQSSDSRNMFDDYSKLMWL